jgi:hypothetical protein
MSNISTDRPESTITVLRYRPSANSYLPSANSYLHVEMSVFTVDTLLKYGLMMKDDDGDIIATPYAVSEILCRSTCKADHDDCPSSYPNRIDAEWEKEIVKVIKLIERGKLK